MTADHDESGRLTRLETLSAWLGLWRPRDVEVPPVPKRKLALIGGIVVLAVAAVAVVAVPAIDSGKDEGAEREADARRRVAAGELDGPVLRVSCRTSPRAAGAHGCTAVTRDVPAGPRNVPGSLGHPFVAVVDFGSGRYTWCKTNPVPAEQVVPDPRDVVELPRECAG